MRTIAIYGGTFDPVHNGHIQTSINIQAKFHFDSYYFLPAKTQITKSQAQASVEDRVKMLQLALEEYPQFSIDKREVERDSPSYMIDTLQSMRAQYPSASITLIMGYDSFASLDKWHKWQQLISFANLLIINREQFKSSRLPEAVETLLAEHQSSNEDALALNKAGTIYLFDAGNYDISSTEIRTKLHIKDAIKQDLPAIVYEYIRSSGLYQ